MHEQNVDPHLSKCPCEILLKIDIALKACNYQTYWSYKSSMFINSVPRKGLILWEPWLLSNLEIICIYWFCIFPFILASFFSALDYHSAMESDLFCFERVSTLGRNATTHCAHYEYHIMEKLNFWGKFWKVVQDTCSWNLWASCVQEHKMPNQNPHKDGDEMKWEVCMSQGGLWELKH